MTDLLLSHHKSSQSSRSGLVSHPFSRSPIRTTNPSSTYQSSSSPKVQPSNTRDHLIWVMLQLLMAVAFSAAPLTLYVPPVRSLNLFVETMEDFVRQTSAHALHAIPRLRLGFRRIIRSLSRIL